MRKPSEPEKHTDVLLAKLIGLGEHSTRKSYYPELQARLEELERFRTLLGQTNDLIFLLTVPTGQIIDVNESASRLLNLSHEDFLARSIFQVTDLDSSPQAQRLITDDSSIQHDSIVVETCFRGADGQCIPTEVTLNRKIFSGIEYVVAVARNIIERKQAQAALAERTRLAELTAEIGRVLTAGGPLRNCLQSCAELLRQYANGLLARIWVYDRQEDMLILQASAGLYTHINGTHSRIPMGSLKVGKIAQTRQPHLTNDVIGDPLIQDQEWAKREGIIAFAGQPMVIEDRLVGVVGLFSQQPLSEPILSTLGGVTDKIAIGIERRKTEENLSKSLVQIREAKEKIDAILSSVADGLIVTSNNNRIVLMNRRAEELIGSGQPTTEQGLSEFATHLLNTIKTADPERPLEWEMGTDEQAQTLVIQARSAPIISQEGLVAGRVTILRDISRERELDLLKNEFISRAAHELRTPLTSVIGYAEVLLRQDEYGPLTLEQQQDFLNCICDQGMRLSGIVDDLLDISRIHNGGLISINKQPCLLQNLILRLVGEYQKISPKHHFEIKLAGHLPKINIDRHKIEQVMENLLSNAVKYAPAGGPVLISIRQEADQCLISVKDKGIGMTQEQAERIFESFYRVDASNTAVEGLGLGMAIAKHAVEAHGGRIWVETSPSRGTTVFFTLPLST